MPNMPHCEWCNQAIPDWSGNVMVNSDYGHVHEIRDARIICKPCTRRIDATGEGNQWHNYWELDWIKNPDSLYSDLQEILEELVSAVEDPGSTHTRWTRPALNRILPIIATGMGAEIDLERHQEQWGRPRRRG